MASIGTMFWPLSYVLEGTARAKAEAGSVSHSSGGIEADGAATCAAAAAGVHLAGSPGLTSGQYGKE